MRIFMDIETLMKALVYYEHHVKKIGLPHHKTLDDYKDVDFMFIRDKNDIAQELVINFIKHDDDEET